MTHVLVIPSEEFVPESAPLAGIFQKNMMMAIHDSQPDTANFRFISIKLKHSPYMAIRALLYRMLNQDVNNDLDQLSAVEIVSLLINKVFSPKKFLRFVERSGIKGIDLECCYLTPPSPRFDHLSWIRGGLVAFDSYRETYGVPDLIHAHNALNAGLLASKIKKRFGIPYVLTEHSSYYAQKKVPPSLIENIRDCYSYANSTIAVSSSLRDTLVTYVSDSCRSMSVLPNALDPVFEKAEPVTTQRVTGNIRLLSVGSLLPVKGHAYLIEALSLLSKKLPEIKISLDIVGEGPCRQELESLSKLSRVLENIRFHGEFDTLQVLSMMQDCDLFVLPSLVETFGVVVIEALACGLPVLSTECGGPNDILDQSNGVFVPPADSAALAEGLHKMILNLDKYDPTQIRQQCMKRFSAKIFSGIQLDIYRQALVASNSQDANVPTM